MIYLFPHSVSALIIEYFHLILMISEQSTLKCIVIILGDQRNFTKHLAAQIMVNPVIEKETIKIWNEIPKTI